MRIYISCHHPEPANQLAALLVSHTVTSTWHSSSEPRPARDDGAAWGRKALENFREILGCDVLCIVGGPERYPGGKFVEAGFALGNGKRVVTVGPVENGMLYHPSVEHADDAAAAAKLFG